MKNNVLCIKIGGRALESRENASAFADEIRTLSTLHRCVVIHGGGAAVSRISERFGLTPMFEDGIRLTTGEDMDVVDMVLAGTVNTALVRAVGRKAVGLSGCDGGTFSGERISESSHTGRVVETDPALLQTLTAAGWIPVVSSVSVDSEGVALNINADDAALAVARSLQASRLIFVSDIPGILADGRVISSMTPVETEEAIEGGIITGGMIPKVRASAAALSTGVGAVAIGSFERIGDLRDFASGNRGTNIVPERT